MTKKQVVPGVDVVSEGQANRREMLTPQALEFVAELVRRFRASHELILRERNQRRHARAGGVRLKLSEETEEIRKAPWTIGPSPIPSALQDRRVELIGTPHGGTI
jgi:malate synthase